MTDIKIDRSNRPEADPGGGLDIPTDPDIWLRRVYAGSPSRVIANLESAAIAGIRRTDRSRIQRPLEALWQAGRDLVGQVKDEALERTEGEAAREAADVRTATSRLASSIGFSAARGRLEAVAGQLEETGKLLHERMAALEGEREKLDGIVNAGRTELRRAVARPLVRLLFPAIFRRRARRNCDAMIRMIELEIRIARHRGACELVARVIEILRDRLHRLADAGTILGRQMELATATRRELSGRSSRVPNFHTEPLENRLETLADEKVFTPAVIDELARRVTEESSEAGTDLESQIQKVLAQTAATAPLPGNIVAHLADLPLPEKERLVEMMAAEAEESAAVDLLIAPRPKRWRIRTIQIPGGRHSPLGGYLESVNPAGIMTRMIDTGDDPGRITVTIEERVLPAVSMREIQRAEELARRCTDSQRAAAVTFWLDETEVLRSRIDGVEDGAEASRLLVHLLALRLVNRDGSGLYIVTDDDLVSTYPGLPEGRISKGFRGTVDRLGGEPSLRQALRDLVTRERESVGVVEFARLLREFRADSGKAVPSRFARDVRILIDEDLERLGPVAGQDPDAEGKRGGGPSGVGAEVGPDGSGNGQGDTVRTRGRRTRG